MTRAEAKASGALTYLGRPCPLGHLEGRYTSTGNCVPCAKSATSARAAAGYFRARYSAKADELRPKFRENYVRNREIRIKQAAAWASNNRDLRRTIIRSYKARRRAQESGGISTRDLRRWIVQQAKVCHWCGARCRDGFHVDHFYPLARGGTHTEDNLVIACADCNRRKGAKDPHAFQRETMEREAA